MWVPPLRMDVRAMLDRGKNPFFEHALRTSAGSLSPRTKWRDLANYEFLLPPLDEQRRIAEILWGGSAMHRLA